MQADRGRDRTFDEDRSLVRSRLFPAVLTTARNIVMSLLRLAGCDNIARGTCPAAWTASWRSLASY